MGSLVVAHMRSLVVAHMRSLVVAHMRSLVVARRLSCPVARMTLISWPGIEPLSPALEDEFLSIGSPGKSGIRYILKVIY